MMINPAHTKPTQRISNFMWPHYPFNSGLKSPSLNQRENRILLLSSSMEAASPLLLLLAISPKTNSWTNSHINNLTKDWFECV